MPRAQGRDPVVATAMAPYQFEALQDHLLEVSASGDWDSVDRLIRTQESYADLPRDIGAVGLVRDLTETVNGAVARLVDLGLLRERTGRSHGRLFEAPVVIEILTARQLTTP